MSETQIDSGHLEDIDIEEKNETSSFGRKLYYLPPTVTSCVGSSLPVGNILQAGESICNSINGEMTYFGVREYPGDAGGDYVMYRLEIWSQYGTYDRWFRGIQTTGTAPNLRMQRDGHLVYASNSAAGDCRARPNARGDAIEVRVEVAILLPTLVTVRDDKGRVVWSLGQVTRSDGSVGIEGSTCYPDEGPKCISSLPTRKKMTWGEYVCEYDADGVPVTRFGLDDTGLLALWRNGRVAWRPGPGWIRGDYLHLTRTGGLKLMDRETDPWTVKWKSTCYRGGGAKVAVSDGNLFLFNDDGSVRGAVVVGDESPEFVCFPRCE